MLSLRLKRFQMTASFFMEAEKNCCSNWSGGSMRGTMEKKSVISLIIPTLNAGNQLQTLLKRLDSQTVKPDEVLIVDSESNDETTATAEAFGAKVLSIRRASFDHGGTRDYALRQSKGDIVIFMTQDACPADENAIAALVAPFDNPRVAAVSGRQIARAEAKEPEKLVREYNYPPVSRTWGEEAIEKYGVKAFMISDVFAAYRREAYLAAGGFDHPIMTNEDMLMAQKLLAQKWLIAYAAEAQVIHSHQFTFRQQFERNKIIGQTMKRYEERFCHVQEIGEGVSMAKKVLVCLVKGGKIEDAFSFCWDCFARLLGNRYGRYIEKRKKHD